VSTNLFIARKRSPGRPLRLVRHSFSEGGSLPISGLTPFLLVPFVLLVLFVPFLPIPFPPPIPNPNLNLNLYCFYPHPLFPFDPFLLLAADLNDSLYFHLFQLYFQIIATGPPRPIHCARATCSQNNRLAISKPYQFRNTIFIFPTFL